MTYWQKWTKNGLWRFLRKKGEGLDQESRIWAKKNIKADNFLDCGCGAGVDYENLKDNVKEYIGIDKTPKMIELCNENFTGGKWIEGDIENIPFGNDVFDVVYCRAVLEHLPDYKKAIDEMKRVAKNKVIILLFNKLGRRKKVKLDDKTYNNTYDKRIVKYLGENTEVINLETYNILIWQKG